MCGIFSTVICSRVSVPVVRNSKIVCSNCLVELGGPLPAHGLDVVLLQGSGGGFSSPSSSNIV